MSKHESGIKYPINEPLPGIEGFCHIAARIFCKESKDRIEGISNLEEIRELSDSGHPILMVGNHRSNADAAALYESLGIADFKDLADKLKYVLGQRLKFDWKTKYLTRGYSHIDIFPPTVSTDEREMRKMKLEMNLAARENAKDVLSNNGILVLFPEATRTRDGVIQDFIPEAMSFALLCSDTHIAPFSLAGTDNVWPVGSNRWHRSEVNVKFGKPFSVEDALIGTETDKEKRLLLANRARLEVLSLSPVEYGGIIVEMNQGREYNIRN